MADFVAPSFSLGLDCDLLGSESQISSVSQDRDPSSSNQFSVGSATKDKNDDFETLVVDDSEPEYPDPHPKLRRLVRGHTMYDTSSSVSAKAKVELHSRAVVDDEDIHVVLSSQEGRRTDAHLYMQHRLVCTSSKFPPNRQGVLTNQPGKREQNVSNALVFPKIIVSSLRRFQLIDSNFDSDDSSVSDGANNRKCNGSESCSNQGQSDLPQHVSLSKQRKVNEPIEVSVTKNPREDFRSEKSFHIPTPAMDEVCEGYFRSMKHKSNAVQTDRTSHVTRSCLDLEGTLPPSHCYFFHDDPRIQELVRSRLPNFLPLGNVSNRDLEQPGASKMDYMGQFSCGESSKQASRKSKTEETSQGWVNPKLGVAEGITKGVVKRKVHAVCQTVGNWLTGADGKKVYVSKKGQELTGRVAYRQYRKESGAGFKNATRKSATKKKK